MESNRHFSFDGRLRSVRFALRGLKVMLVSQHNAWVHAAATLAVIIAGMLFRITAAEWCFIAIAVVAVWTAEALNTAFEILCDVASPEFHPLVERSKDVAAGAVLVSALGAVAVGIIIFAPRILTIIQNILV